MGSGGRWHKFWCDKCQCYVNFSNYETCESICEYCEARENKARVKTAEAEVERLRAQLNALVTARAEAEEAGYRRAIDDAYAGLTTLLHSFAGEGEGEASAYVAGATDGINAARGEVRSLFHTAEQRAETGEHVAALGTAP